MAFTPVIEESVGMDSPHHHQHGEVLLSLLARHKSLEGKNTNTVSPTKTTVSRVKPLPWLYLECLCRRRGIGLSIAQLSFFSSESLLYRTPKQQIVCNKVWFTAALLDRNIHPWIQIRC